jgi:predicted RNA binding protein YcfA (HicA-like mRNA interferase family)
MSQLPLVTAKEVIKVLNKIGWTVTRQRGSHVILTKPGSIFNIVVPDHGRTEIKRGLLKKIIKDAEITEDWFCKLLHD